MTEINVNSARRWEPCPICNGDATSNVIITSSTDGWVKVQCKICGYKITLESPKLLDYLGHIKKLWSVRRSTN